MVYCNVILSVKDAADIETVRSLVAEQRRRSLTEPGCERFEVYHSTDDPSVFLLVERWSDEAALAAHREAKAFQELYIPKVIPLVNRTPHICDLVE